MINLILFWNACVFVLFGIDKFCAIHNFRRISEFTLITLSFLLGGIGGLCGMYLFRHKTKKIKFKLLIPLAFIINLFAVIIFKKYL